MQRHSDAAFAHHTARTRAGLRATMPAAPTHTWRTCGLPPTDPTLLGTSAQVRVSMEESPSPSTRVFVWQAAFKFGRPRIFLADGVFEVIGREYFFGGREFFGGHPRMFWTRSAKFFPPTPAPVREFVFWRPRFFFFFVFFVFVCPHACGPIVIIRKGKDKSKQTTSKHETTHA